MLNLVALMTAVNRFQTPIMFTGVTAMTFMLCVMLFDSSKAKAEAPAPVTYADTIAANAPCDMNVTGLAAWECLDKIERAKLGY